MKIIKKFENQLKTTFFKILKRFKIYDKEYHLFGLDLKKEKEFRIIYEKCKFYTMTGVERMFYLYKAVEFIVKNNIPGDIVECGVWKGGSMMICALALLNLNDTSRKLYLYDTYEGSVKPTKKDISYKNVKALEMWTKVESSDAKLYYSPLEDVKENMYSTGYPKDKMEFIKGKVEDTLPKIVPEKISILRLDTDWYDSTYHELIHLYPRLVKNGVILLDDYGLWKGVREATDKYFKENNITIYLSRIDSNGRFGIKLN